MSKTTSFRLPKEVIPKHYTFQLTPDFKTFNFTASLTIKLQVNERTEKITLNSIDLILNKVVLKGKNGFQEAPEHINICLENETVEFIFPNTIAPDSCELFIDYSGEIGKKLRGIYQCKYVNKSGESIYTVVTQFAAANARRCLPCWDEPAFKSSFDIILIVPKKQVAVSNTPVKSTIEIKDLRQYYFETTPIMSTYLVAFVIGQFDYIEGKSSDGVLVRVYTSPCSKNLGNFALDMATKTLPFYKEYFGMPYSLPKLDLLAVANFGYLAMENWGLIIFQESGLLVDFENTSASQKLFVAALIGHEIAHQWFGNLVTTEWWTHIWLNEGFANFIQYLCVQHLFPQYEIWTQFLNDTYMSALNLDCLNNSHPIEIPILSTSDVDEIFDEISYDKGASIIRMLHYFIGEEKFKKGLQVYLNNHQYKNAETDDVLLAWEEVSQKPIVEVFSTWTKQMGFPVVEASTKLENDGKGVVLSLIQSKYCINGTQPSEKYFWKIPISISTSKDPKKEIVSTMLTDQRAEIVIPDVENQDWIKINPGCIGFYYTNYSEEMLKKLALAIKDKSLPSVDRLGVLNDLFAMVQAGHKSTVEVLTLFQAYTDEIDYSVWTTICKILNKLDSLLAYKNCESTFSNFKKFLLSKIAQKLGWHPLSTETHTETLLRGLILEQLAWLDDEKTIKEAQKAFNASAGDCSLVLADLRIPCYICVLRSGNQDTLKTMMELYRSTDLREEKERISQAFGAVKDESLLSKILDFSISDDVQSQDTLSMMLSVASTRPGRFLAWEFFKNHWKQFLERYQGSFLLNRTIRSIAGSFVTRKMALEVETFFKEHSFPGTERTVKQAVEYVQLNAAWLSRDTDVITTFLKSFKQ